uniref:Uncharacterized protein n=1 Tax=Sinocyclocheilus grahami TaxID=75366 RepID=A0A672S2A5_SINGR
MIEMECFKEINVFEMDGALCSDLDVNKPNPAPKRGFFYRLFHREASATVPPHNISTHFYCLMLTSC